MAKGTVDHSCANTNSQLVSRRAAAARDFSINVTGVRFLRGDRTARIQFDVDLWLAGMYLPGVATWHGDADLSEESFSRIDVWPQIEELQDAIDRLYGEDRSQVIVDLIADATWARLRFTQRGGEMRIAVPECQSLRSGSRRAARALRARREDVGALKSMAQAAAARSPQP
jgi:hypothetical protein